VILVCFSLIIAEIVMNFKQDTLGIIKSESIKSNSYNTIELDSIDWENVTTTEEMMEEE